MKETYSSCDCTSVDPGPPLRGPKAIEVQIVPGSLPDKARVYIGSGVMQVGADFWDPLDGLQRYGVVAHERAHEEQPQENCESCIDMRAGAIMRHEGISRDGVRHALAGLVSSRDAAKYAVDGWDAADEAIRAGHVNEGRRSFDNAASLEPPVRYLDGDEVSIFDDPEGQSLVSDSSEQDAIDRALGTAPPKAGASPPKAGASPPKAGAAPPAPLSSTAKAVIGALAVAVVAGVLVHVLIKVKVKP